MLKVCVPVKPAFGVSPWLPGTVVEVPIVSFERYAVVLIKEPTKSMLFETAGFSPRSATLNENVNGPVPVRQGSRY